MKPGDLIKYTGDLALQFCPVDDADRISVIFSWRNSPSISKDANSVLLFLKPLAYKSQFSYVSIFRTIMAALLVSAATRCSKMSALVRSAEDLALKEYEVTGEIQGSVFLTGCGKRVWISHYDLKEIRKK